MTSKSFRAFLAGLMASRDQNTAASPLMPLPSEQGAHPKGAFGSFRGSRRSYRVCRRMARAMAYDHEIMRNPPQVRSEVPRYRTVQKVRLFFGTVVGRYLADRATMRVFWATAPR